VSMRPLSTGRASSMARFTTARTRGKRRQAARWCRLRRLEPASSRRDMLAAAGRDWGGDGDGDGQSESSTTWVIWMGLDSANPNISDTSFALPVGEWLMVAVSLYRPADAATGGGPALPGATLNV
jgi:hypothetical protein